MRRERLHRKRPGNADDVLAFIRLVIEHFLFRLFIVRKRLERDMRYGLILESGGNVHLRIIAVFLELVIRKFRDHEPRARQGKRHPRGVNGNPPPPPLFGDVCARPAPARRIEHQIARIRGHEDATLDDLCSCLNDILLFISKPASSYIHPHIINRQNWKIIKISFIAQGVS